MLNARPSSWLPVSDARYATEYHSGRSANRVGFGSWVLPDGSKVGIRPMRPDDIRLAWAFMKALSPESRYQRLMSARKLSFGELLRLTDLDPKREWALIATTPIDGAERQLGVVRCVRETDGVGAELAIVVADAWQGLGLGERLLRSMIRVAAEAGVQVLNGITFSTNARLIALARKLGFELQREPGDGTVTRLTKRLESPVAPIVV